MSTERFPSPRVCLAVFPALFSHASWGQCVNSYFYKIFLFGFSYFNCTSCSYMMLLIYIFVLFLDSVCHRSLSLLLFSFMDQELDMLIGFDRLPNFLVFAYKILNSSPQFAFSVT